MVLISFHSDTVIQFIRPWKQNQNDMGHMLRFPAKNALGAIKIRTNV